ncbi:MAG: glycosyltransferase family 4 protein, partial [Candidatus Falkowbacteria bacterium]|nr:glycosyltransferase family 4 protein [Candidatus Falkowbacteria bacterium]
MKIAQIVCVFPPYRGGIGNAAYNFALELARLNNEVTVFTPARSQQRANFSGFNFIELSPFLYYGNGAFLPQLFGRLKNFDIVHLHYPFFGGAELVWFSKILGQAGKKLVIHYHMDIQDLPALAKILSLPDYFIRKSLFVRAEAITCASLDYLKNSQIRKLYQQMSAKFMEIPFGVDSERFKPNSNWLQQKNNILFVGSLDRAHSFKGLNVLLDSLVLLKKEIKLTVVGGGDLLAQYQAQVEKRQIQARVNFAGAVAEEELPNFYQHADLLVLPSLNAHEA